MNLDCCVNNLSSNGISFHKPLFNCVIGFSVSSVVMGLIHSPSRTLRHWLQCAVFRRGALLSILRGSPKPQISCLSDRGGSLLRGEPVRQSSGRLLRVADLASSLQVLRSKSD